MVLRYGRWYAIAKFRSIDGDALVGRYMGGLNNSAVFYGYHSGNVLRGMHTVSVDNVLAEVPDPRIIIQIGMWIGRNMLGLRYIT